MDYKDPNNDWRTWMTLRGHNGECVVSWFERDEFLLKIKVT